MLSYNSIFQKLSYLPLFWGAFNLHSQSSEIPQLSAGKLTGTIEIDGQLLEEDWKQAPMINNFKTIEPKEGGEPSGATTVRVIANEKRIVFGIQCFDNQPNRIVRFSKLRDSDIDNEDHIRIVIDPFQDGQSGYILAINAYGARYDALVSNRGESENANWDAVWDAAAIVHSEGWSAEISLPIQSINFKKGLDTWGFNVERRIQRNQETARWTNIRRDQWFIQTSRAGLLTGLPPFNYGIGLNVRPSLIASLDRKVGIEGTDFSFSPSLDANQRIGPNVLATLTVNTDFAETDVDTRQTNLTRFPLFFPERRSFFLEGSDIFEFGFGTSDDTVLPFFSRRIGLLAGQELPISTGLKLNGRIGKTAFGALGVRMDDHMSPDFSTPSTTMGVIRVRHNILKESSFGIISSFGDPLGRNSSWMSGADFTYQTTRFQGNKNLIAGAWFLGSGRDDLGSDSHSWGFKVDYPNDRWDAALTYTRIGKEFDPSLGFVPRRGVHYFRYSTTFAPRPKIYWIRQMFHQFFITYVKETDGPWQSYSIFTAPINWRLESGDRIELNVRPVGENILIPFEVADGVVIEPGPYHFIRYRFEGQLAAKRKFNGLVKYWFGPFYNGHLDEIEADINWNPSQLITMELSGVHNRGRLPEGNFDQTLLGYRIRFNVTSNLQLNSFVQYDTDSRQVGWNARIHWIFNPLGDLFVVYNDNSIKRPGERWELQNRQLLVKARYNFRW